MSEPSFKMRVHALKARLWLCELEQTKQVNNLKVLTVAIDEARHKVRESEINLEMYGKGNPDSERLLKAAEQALDNIPKRTL